jgi:hypothetical protein
MGVRIGFGRTQSAQIRDGTLELVGGISDWMTEPERGEGYVELNPSCRTNAECQDAWPIDGRNKLKTLAEGVTSFSIEALLRHSITPEVHFSP